MFTSKFSDLEIFDLGTPNLDIGCYIAFNCILNCFKKLPI